MCELNIQEGGVTFDKLIISFAITEAKLTEAHTAGTSFTCIHFITRLVPMRLQKEQACLCVHYKSILGLLFLSQRNLLMLG